jgi:hypothetical protein
LGSVNKKKIEELILFLDIISRGKGKDFNFNYILSMTKVIYGKYVLYHIPLFGFNNHGIISVNVWGGNRSVDIFDYARQSQTKQKFKERILRSILHDGSS